MATPRAQRNTPCDRLYDFGNGGNHVFKRNFSNKNRARRILLQLEIPLHFRRNFRNFFRVFQMEKESVFAYFAHFNFRRIRRTVFWILENFTNRIIKKQLINNIFIGVTHMQSSLQHMPDTWEIRIEKIK